MPGVLRWTEAGVCRESYFILQPHAHPTTEAMIIPPIQKARSVPKNCCPPDVRLISQNASDEHKINKTETVRIFCESSPLRELSSAVTA